MLFCSRHHQSIIPKVISQRPTKYHLWHGEDIVNHFCVQSTCVHFTLIVKIDYISKIKSVLKNQCLRNAECTILLKLKFLNQIDCRFYFTLEFIYADPSYRCEQVSLIRCRIGHGRSPHVTGMYSCNLSNLLTNVAGDTMGEIIKRNQFTY